MNVGDKVYLYGKYESVILEKESVGKSFICKIKILKDKWIGWFNSYELTKIGDDKMEIIKFKPTNYEYVEGIHCVDFYEENFVYIEGNETWGNRSILRIQIDNEGKVINKFHSFYFQLVDGTKKILNVQYLINNSDLEERLIKYLVDYENEYLFNLMQESETDNDALKTLQKAYEEVEQTIYKSVNFFKDDKVTKVKEHEINELIFEIEQINLENAINKALDENDKESFMKLTGGVE